MTEAESVMEAWGEDGNNIRSYQAYPEIKDLRFRNGKLQMKRYTEVQFIKPVWRSLEGDIKVDTKAVWFDVPMVNDEA